MLTYSVSGINISKTEDGELTSGMIGAKVKFIFDNAWAYMTKVAVFRGDNAYNVVDVVITGDPTREVELEIPAKILEKTRTLRVGVYGTTGDDATPTVWADPKEVEPGAIPSGITAPIPDTLPQQLLDAVNDAVQTAQSVRDDADNDVFIGDQGIQGKSYNPKGAWVSGVSYTNDQTTIDTVSYSGNSYYCKTSHSGVSTTPNVDNTNWGILASFDAGALETQISAVEAKAADNQSKVVDITNVLANMNPDQSAKNTLTGFNALALPKTSANGNLGVGLKGSTLKNELNYNRDTWAEWVKAAGIVGDATGLEFTASNGSNIIATLSTNLKPSAKYGFLYNVISNTLTTVFLESITTTESFSYYNPLTKTVGNQKIMLTTQPTITTNRVSFSTSTAETTGNKIKIKDIRVFELPTGSPIETDFNTLTADQLAAKYPYIKGDTPKSTAGAGRFRRFGKNLFPLPTGNVTTGGITATCNNGFITLNGTVTANSSIGILGSIRASYSGNRQFFYLPAGTYTLRATTISGTKSSTIPFSLWKSDGTRPIQDNESVIDTSASFTTSGMWLSEIHMSIAIGRVFTNYTIAIQLEQNSVATPYEPYISPSSLYFNSLTDLRSVPNGIKDEIRKKSDGGYEEIQNIYKLVIDGNITTYTFDIFTYGSYSTRIGIYTSSVRPEPYGNWSIPDTTLPFYDDRLFAIYNNQRIKTAGHSSFETATEILAGFEETGNKLYFSIPHSISGWASLPTKDQVKTFLNNTPIIMYYQLATPVITPISTSGLLLSQPSGTVILEPALSVAGVYGATGIPVTYNQYPIASLETLYKVDYLTGAKTELSVSTAVISPDKLSFMHPSLTTGDVVFFTYFFSSEYPVGEMSATYFDSRYVLKDSVTNKFYKWTLSLANGIPSFNFDEVI